MGEISFKQFLKTHIMKQSIAFQTKNINSPWWDNIHTKSKKETRSDILNMSFKQAISSLNNQLGNDVNSWTWNKVHKVEYKHPLGSVALFKPFFNVGKFSISGTNEVINNTMFDYSDEAQHIVKAGPSTRRIIDFSDIENSWSILPTGQSGNPMSTHYNDQAEMYLQGKFRKMKLNKEEIIKTSTKLIFKAK
jgi:penicillin amidase